MSKSLVLIILAIVWIIILAAIAFILIKKKKGNTSKSASKARGRASKGRQAKTAGRAKGRVGKKQDTDDEDEDSDEEEDLFSEEDLFAQPSAFTPPPVNQQTQQEDPLMEIARQAISEPQPQPQPQTQAQQQPMQDIYNQYPGITSDAISKAKENFFEIPQSGAGYITQEPDPILVAQSLVEILSKAISQGNLTSAMSVVVDPIANVIGNSIYTLKNDKKARHFEIVEFFDGKIIETTVIDYLKVYVIDLGVKVRDYLIQGDLVIGNRDAIIEERMKLIIQHNILQADKWYIRNIDK